MKDMILNETPLRTSVNFNINDIKLKDVNIPSNINKFENLNINYDNSKVKVEEKVDDYNITYGVSESLTKSVQKSANNEIKIVIEKNLDEAIFVDFNFDKENINLISNIEIVANKDTKATVILRYECKDELKCFHNQILKVFANENSNIDIVIINFMNLNSNNFVTIDNEIYENAKVNYTIIDFGGKNSITNYYSNLLGKFSENILNTIYLGSKDQIFDLNYIAHLRGENSNVDIEVEGALKDTSKKHFKGTIDFKKGSKKSVGNENESCMLLSDTAKSLSLPMLLCSEEDVTGNHASSAGKIDSKELFYIMSRGFKEKEAIKLMVRAKFNKIIETINSEILKNEILSKIDEKLD